MDQKEKTDIKSLNLKELTVFMEQLGEKAFRAKQIYQWLHGQHKTGGSTDLQNRRNEEIPVSVR